MHFEESLASLLNKLDHGIIDSVATQLIIKMAENTRRIILWLTDFDCLACGPYVEARTFVDSRTG